MISSRVGMYGLQSVALVHEAVYPGVPRLAALLDGHEAGVQQSLIELGQRRHLRSLDVRKPRERGLVGASLGLNMTHYHTVAAT